MQIKERRLRRVFEFHAAHHLPYHKGKCCNQHGHTYKLEVEVAGVVRADNGSGHPETGMIVDFSTLDRVINRVVDKMDHKNLNDYLQNPTAEELVEEAARMIREELSSEEATKELHLKRVVLWETARACAIIDLY